MYYEIVKQPIDLATIRNKIENKKYRAVEEFESDMKLLFRNARRFDSRANLPEDQVVSRDADALEYVLKTCLSELCDYDMEDAEGYAEDGEEDDFQYASATETVSHGSSEAAGVYIGPDELENSTDRLFVSTPVLERWCFGDLLSVYAFLRSFCSLPGLCISTFNLEDLMYAVAAPCETRLIAEINLCILRLLKYAQIVRELDKKVRDPSMSL